MRCYLWCNKACFFAGTHRSRLLHMCRYGAKSRSQALHALRPLIQNQLDGYSTSVDEDVSLLADDGRAVGGVGSRRWNAVQYVLVPL